MKIKKTLVICLLFITGNHSLNSKIPRVLLEDPFPLHRLTSRAMPTTNQCLVLPENKRSYFSISPLLFELRRNFLSYIKTEFIPLPTTPCENRQKLKQEYIEKRWIDYVNSLDFLGYTALGIAQLPPQKIIPGNTYLDLLLDEQLSCPDGQSDFSDFLKSKPQETQCDNGIRPSFFNKDLMCQLLIAGAWPTIHFRAQKKDGESDNSFFERFDMKAKDITGRYACLTENNLKGYYPANQLCFYHVDLSENGLKALEGFNNLQRIASLDLACNVFTSLQPIAEITNSMPNLNRLILTGNVISDYSGIEKLGALQHLRHLNFSRNQFPATIFSVIYSSIHNKGFPSLAVLNVSLNPLNTLNEEQIKRSCCVMQINNTVNEEDSAKRGNLFNKLSDFFKPLAAIRIMRQWHNITILLEKPQQRRASAPW